MKASGKNIVIFFGSQTGTAEEFARRLAKNARLYGLKALVVDPEEIDTVNIFKSNFLKLTVNFYLKIRMIYQD
jgi:NADPH-ferrihemoprotein reductase